MTKQPSSLMLGSPFTESEPLFRSKKVVKNRPTLSKIIARCRCHFYPWSSRGQLFDMLTKLQCVRSKAAVKTQGKLYES